MPLLDRVQEPAEVGHGVDALIRLRRVGRPAGEGHLDQRVAAQALGDGQRGRLPHHDDVGVDAEPRQGGEHGLGAGAGVLLVRDERQHDATRGPALGELLRGHDHGRDTTLHVARAATGEPVCVDGRGERVGHALDADGVEVTVQDHRGAGRPVGADRDQARAVVAPAAWMTWVVKPLRCNRIRRCSTIAASPAAPGTSPGFTESMATSSAVSATALAPSSSSVATTVGAARGRDGAGQGV